MTWQLAPSAIVVAAFHHSCHPGFLSRQLAGVIARHLGIIPATRMHDAGQINAAGREIMGSADPRGMRGDVIYGPRALVRIALDIEQSAYPLNYPRYLLRRDG